MLADVWCFSLLGLLLFKRIGQKHEQRATCNGKRRQESWRFKEASPLCSAPYAVSFSRSSRNWHVLRKVEEKVENPSALRSLVTPRTTVYLIDLEFRDSQWQEGNHIKSVFKQMYSSRSRSVADSASAPFCNPICPKSTEVPEHARLLQTLLAHATSKKINH